MPEITKPESAFLKRIRNYFTLPQIFLILLFVGYLGYVSYAGRLEPNIRVVKACNDREIVQGDVTIPAGSFCQNVTRMKIEAGSLVPHRVFNPQQDGIFLLVLYGALIMSMLSSTKFKEIDMFMAIKMTEEVCDEYTKVSTNSKFYCNKLAKRQDKIFSEGKKKNKWFVGVNEKLETNNTLYYRAEIDMETGTFQGFTKLDKEFDGSQIYDERPISTQSIEDLAAIGEKLGVRPTGLKVPRR